MVAALDDPLLDEEGRYSLERWGYQSQLSMPLVSRGRVLGVAELSDYEPRDFAEDLDLIRGLGQVAAHALDNASLFEQVDRRNRTLNELVELSSLASHSRDLDQLVRSVAERVLSAVDAANCDIYRSMEGTLLCVASFDRSGHDDSVLGGKFDLERYPTTAEAVYGHQILTITSPDDPQLSQAERDTYHDYGFSSEVCLPLVIGDELYGLLDVYDTRERDFAEYLGFLRGTAQALAGAFENALLVDQLERRTTILRDVVELGAVASQAHDLETVLTALAVRLRETVGAADCDIFTLKDGMLRCMVSADKDGLDASVVGRILDVDRFPATALAVRTGQPMAIASLDDPHLTDEEREDMAEYGFESELCIPLLGGDRVIGLIDVFDTRPRDYAEYLDFLRSVGQTAAGAIENAVLLDKLERRNAALAELVELGRTASDAGGLKALVRSVGPRVVELMEADGCQVFILRGDSLHCVLTYDDGQFLDDYADRTLDLDLFPSTRAAIAEKSALIIETPEDPRLSDYERGLYLESGSQSEICVPLVLEDRVVGLLDVYDHRRRDYAEHRDFLLRVGQMMAGALENALLMERLEETNETLGLLVESGIEFGATLDRDRLLESVALRLCAAAAAPCCEITTLHGDALRVVARMDHGEADGDHIGTEYPLDHLGLMRIALETRRPAYAEDITDDPRVSDLERERDPRGGHRAMLCLPLTSRGEVIGVAVVHDDRARTFTRTDLLHSLAQVAAGALANAELYEGIKSMHLGNLKALSSALNAKDYYTLGHAARVAAYMALLGRELGWPDEFLRDVEEAAYLHDIGKIGVPDRVLMKPSGLNEHEWRLMRQHPMFSAEIIHSLFAESLVAGVRHHHERWDGGGYP
ncbi:MAG TPA: GAF domain-containing protein, partial [Gaiellaceae bacterium]|nr:GAF domain-containing protein [Gaiellaceae bacterium]